MQAIAVRAARRRARSALARLTRADLDNDSFRYEAAAILRQAVGFDWWCWPLADPGARLPTRYVGVDAPTDQDQRRFCRLVLEAWDGGQHRGRGGSQPPVVTTLSAATGGDLSRDLFWREILGPAGAGDVLDVMLATDGVCWGQLHLGRDSPGGWFGEDEAGFVGEVAPLIAARLRDGLRAPRSCDGPDPEPGTIIVDRTCPWSRRPTRRGAGSTGWDCSGRTAPNLCPALSTPPPPVSPPRRPGRPGARGHRQVTMAGSASVRASPAWLDGFRRR